MIRKLSREDHDLLYNYLKDEASINLFTLGDLEVFGYEADFQDIWGQFDDQNQLVGTLFRFYHSYMPYAKGDFDVEAFTEIMLQDDKFEALQGKSELVQRFEQLGRLPIVDSQETYFAELRTGDKLDPLLDTSAVKLATLDDVDRILDVRHASFKSGRSAREQLVKVMESGMARTFYIEDESTGQIVASASTTAENSLSAMIIAVSTRDEYRNRGLASSCMTALCRQLLAEGRILCLFYHNPAAGSIYKRLGFEDISMWRMCKSPLLVPAQS